MGTIMAANALPILLVAGAGALAFGSKKKRRRRSASPVSEEVEKVKDLVESTKELAPDLEGAIIEETTLEFEEKPTGPAAGDFEIEKTLLEYDEEDDAQEPEKAAAPLSPREKYAQMKEKCDTFIDAIHVTPTEPDEMPIQKVAVEQSILPAMEASAQAFAQNLGTPLDEETVGPRLVLAGLESVAPDCGWEFSDATGEFRYADGKLTADNAKLANVIGSMIDLSVVVLSKFNGQQVQ